jgi:hypothetical protein
MSLFPQKSLLFRISLSGPGRSLVENDRPPSFRGAPDGWYAPRFLSIFLAMGVSRFEGESPLTTHRSSRTPLARHGSPHWKMGKDWRIGGRKLL